MCVISEGHIQWSSNQIARYDVHVRRIFYIFTTIKKQCINMTCIATSTIDCDTSLYHVIQDVNFDDCLVNIVFGQKNLRCAFFQ